MADQSDVENALAALVANALYPQGSAAPGVVTPLCRVYRGYPVPSSLDADLAAGIVNISVAATAAGMKNVTRYPRIWQDVAPVTQTLTVAVKGLYATFAGTCAAGQLAGIMVDDQAFSYAVQATDSPATVASNLAAQIRAAGWIVDYEGSMLAMPTALRVKARVVAGVTALKELRRQVQEFSISFWCPDPATRDEVVPVVDVALTTPLFMPLADGSYGRVRFEQTVTEDKTGEASLYRRNLVYDVEYPTTLTQMSPAMLFGTLAVSVNATVIGNFES